MKLNEMGEVLAVEFLGFPTVVVSEPLVKYWFGYFGHYETKDFREAFRWTVRRNKSGFPPTPGQVMTELAKKPPPRKQIAAPIFIEREPSVEPKTDLDIVFEYWGASEYQRMLLELLADIAPTIKVDPTKLTSVLQLTYLQRGTWAPRYKQWLRDQVEMIRNLEAHPV